MKRRNNGLVLSLLGIIGLIVITAGVTYAFFNYAKQGTTENSITTGTITFLYTEVSGIGRGISIDDAFPISDTQGKAQTGEGKVFDFKVVSTTPNASSISYEVTARKKGTSTLDESAVKLYLTKVSGDSEEEVLLDNFNNLDQTDKVEADTYIEKTIYTGRVLANQANYEQNFRLRMWIDSEVDFSPNEDGTYPYNNKSFTVTVNVYANAKVVTEEETYQAYNIGDEITLIDGSKWHVLEASDENTETVVLLSDYNLNSDGTYNTECGRDIDSTYACSTMAFDSDNTNTYDENDSNNIGYFIKNTYAPLILDVLPYATNITLPTAYQIALADDEIFNLAGLYLNSSWLVTINYWTKTADTSSDNNTWYVYGVTSVLSDNSSNNSYTYGARPAITVPKSYIVEAMSSTDTLSVGTAVEAIDGSKWHVLEASGSDSRYVTLLSDYNLNSDGTYNTECGTNINNNAYCSTMSFDPDNTNIYDETDSNNIGYFIKNTYAPLTKGLLETTNVTLPTIEQLGAIENLEIDVNSLNNYSVSNVWLTTTNYWTKTSNTYISEYVWLVWSDNKTIHSNSSYPSDCNGVRPVITTLKSNLLTQ